MKRAKVFGKYLSLSCFTIFLVWATLFSFEWIGTYFQDQPFATYSDVSPELKLKSEPKDVIYSQIYKTASGTDEVKYAYLAGEVSPILNEDISRRTPNSQTEVIDTKLDESAKTKTETLKTTIYSGLPQMYEDDGEWRHVEYATTTGEVFAISGAIPYVKRRELAERILPAAPVFAVTSTFYPDPDAEVSSVDGHVDYYSSDCQYSGCPGYQTGTIINDAGTGFFSGCTASYLDLFPDYIWSVDEYVSYVLFDTTSLPDSITISSATFSIWPTNNFALSSQYLNILRAVTSSNTALTGTDSVTGSGYITPIQQNTISTGSYLNNSLNSTGIGDITPTGVTKIAVYTSSNPCGAFQNVSYYTLFSSADTSGTTQDPKLVIDYTVTSSFSIGQWFPF